MVHSRSLISRLGALSLVVSTALAGVIGNDVFARDASCECTEENHVVRYIVIEMPEQPASPPPPVNEPNPGQNTTHTLGPCKDPNIDVSNPENIVPATKISLFYSEPEGGSPVIPVGPVGGAASATPSPKASSAASAKPSAASGMPAAAASGKPGPFSNSTFTTVVPTEAPASSINMTLTMNSVVVALENIQAVASVVCTEDSLTVTFSERIAFQKAADSWSVEEDLVLVTNHLGNCDTELERGFFRVARVASSATDLSISCSATKQKLEEIASDCEMTFSSLPAATLTRRITLDPSLSLNFGAALGEPTVLYSLPPYLSVSADEAAFTSTVTFSGYLHYNFWAFKLTDLYFDIDASFQADVAVSAYVQAAFARSFVYAPDALSYSLVNVPGIVSLGPGVAFGIGLDLDASAAVDVHASVGVGIPAGNVHVDFLNSKRTGTSGWEPVFTAKADISERAVVAADVSASLTVELAIKVLGGLIDLSSGLTAVPRFNNRFTLASKQEADAGTGVSLPPTGAAICDQGVGIKSDFMFNLTGFVTKYWSTNLYGVEVPIVDECYKFT